MQKILLLEDDTTLGSGIRLALQSPSVQITLCRTLAQAQNAFGENSYDLLILDINLPDGSGLDLLEQVRKTSDVPMILLTANDMEIDIVTGLESGADDYITKPFSLAILRARVNAQLRRGIPAKTSCVEIESFLFDFDRMEFRKAGQIIELSKTEQKTGGKPCPAIRWWIASGQTGRNMWTKTHCPLPSSDCGTNWRTHLPAPNI